MPDSTPSCPKGKKACPIYDEVEQLKEQVSLLATQVHTDALTSLHNKRHFINAIEVELERSCRTHQPTSLILLDIDHFKRINDTYGHLAGDTVLQHMATAIKNSIRKIDIACRYGGEEFAVILPSTPLLTAIQVSERIRENIAALTIDIGEQQLSATASFGVAIHLHSLPSNVETFVERADKQLYRAKHNGRNQVCSETLPTKQDHQVADAEKSALFDDTPPNHK